MCGMIMRLGDSMQIPVDIMHCSQCVVDPIHADNCILGAIIMEKIAKKSAKSKQFAYKIRNFGKV